jgi:hypothetical protein
MGDVEMKQPAPSSRNRIMLALGAGVITVLLAVGFLATYSFKSDEAYYQARDTIRDANLDFIEFENARVNLLDQSVTLENVRIETGGAGSGIDILVDAIILSDIREAGREYEAATIRFKNVRLPVRDIVEQARERGDIYQFTRYPGRIFVEAALLGHEELVLDIVAGFDLQRRAEILDLNIALGVDGFYGAEARLVFEDVDDRLFSSEAFEALTKAFMEWPSRPGRVLEAFLKPHESRLDDLALASISLTFHDDGYFARESFLSTAYYTEEEMPLGDRLSRDDMISGFEGAKFSSRDAVEITDAVMGALRPSGRMTLRSTTDRAVTLFKYRDGRIRDTEEMDAPGRLAEAMRIEVSN